MSDNPTKDITKSFSKPYYAVIFTSIRSEQDNVIISDNLENPSEINSITYGKMAERMVTLAAKQDGFLGVDSARDSIGITVSYWRDLASIQKWKSDLEHMQAQKLGRKNWYANYNVRIAKVEKDYSF